MKITALKRQVKNIDRVSVFVDQKYSFSLTDSEVLQLGIKNGLHVSPQDIESFKKLSADGKVRARTLEWVLARPHSQKELQDYLYRKKVDPELADKIKQECEQRHYIDDVSYAEWYVQYLRRKNKSSKAVRYELMKKGISNTIVQDIMQHYESDDASIHAVMQKIDNKPRYADPQKKITYLLSKGFSYSDIKQAMAVQLPEE